MTRQLVELSGPASGQALSDSSIVVLPTGAIEHHGAHLPLATDLLTADLLSAAVVDAAAAQGLDVWRLPPLAYTKSNEHSWAAGTLWISAQTLLTTVVEIATALTTTGAGALVFYNGHGGNTALLQVALREIRLATGLRTFLMGAGIPAGNGESGADEKGFNIHGGHGETSLIMHLRPELVHLDLAQRAVPDQLAGFRRVGFNGFPVAFGWTSDDFGSGGVIGDPTGASADAGAAIAAAAVRDGVASLEEISRFRHARVDR